MFDTTVGEEANLGQTARPPETLPLHIPSGPSPDKPSQPRLSLEIDDKPGIVQALPTPMPGTNLPLEDPFNDATVALCPDHTARKMLSGRPGSDEGYFPNEESDAETTKNPTSGIVATTKMSAPSETQYDADAEPSDGSEVLVDQAKRPTVKSHLRHHNHDRNSTQDYQLGTELFRCKTPPDARASTLHAVPRLILKKPTSDDSEEVALSLSAGNEAIMQFADRAEEGLTGIGTSPASDVLKTKDRQECLTPTNLSPKLQLGKSRLEGVENVYRADVREPTKVRN